MKNKTLLLSILGVAIFGVVGLEVYERYFYQPVENFYKKFELSAMAPFTWNHHDLINGEKIILSWLNEGILVFDMDTFQAKREFSDHKGMDIEDMTVVELRFKNTKSILLLPVVYTPIRDKVINIGGLGGQVVSPSYDDEEELVIFLINENRVNLENFSKLNPSAYVMTLPSRTSLHKDYTQYFIALTMVPINQNFLIEVETFVYNLTDKLASLE